VIRSAHHFRGHAGATAARAQATSHADVGTGLALARAGGLRGNSPIARLLFTSLAAASRETVADKGLHRLLLLCGVLPVSACSHKGLRQQCTSNAGAASTLPRAPRPLARASHFQMPALTNCKGSGAAPGLTACPCPGCRRGHSTRSESAWYFQHVSRRQAFRLDKPPIVASAWARPMQQSNQATACTSRAVRMRLRPTILSRRPPSSAG
jgi:hypothetical protein